MGLPSGVRQSAQPEKIARLPKVHLAASMLVWVRRNPTQPGFRSCWE
jgi:hypothetical protein